LAEVAAEDLDVARLFEAHLDALAILAELGTETDPGHRWAVWASEPPNGRVAARPGAGGEWVLDGVKRWCSGAHVCTAALVTAHADDGPRLFAVALNSSGVRPGSGGWAGLGMAESDTQSVELSGVTACAVGGPEAYLRRIGFWYGAIGVAACWHGGAVAIGRRLHAAARDGKLDGHGLAHLGAVYAGLAAAGAMLRKAAEAVDEEKHPPRSEDPAAIDEWRRRALAVRAVV
jgi:alkylation response protein AidB-like acyl-CoA dehydrogenase